MRFQVSAGVNEICYVLGFNTALMGGFLLTFRENILGVGTSRLPCNVSEQLLFYAT